MIRVVYSSGTSRRPGKYFGTESEAVSWAVNRQRTHPDSRPVVVRTDEALEDGRIVPVRGSERVVWDWMYGLRATVCAGKVRYTNAMNSLTLKRAMERDGRWAMRYCTQCLGYHVEARR